MIFCVRAILQKINEEYDKIKETTAGSSLAVVFQSVLKFI